MGLQRCVVFQTKTYRESYCAGWGKDPDRDGLFEDAGTHRQVDGVFDEGIQGRSNDILRGALFDVDYDEIGDCAGH